MIVLSLFDGIAGARVALEKANIKVDKYYASEIDPYAIKIANKNYPDIIQLGDINSLNYKELPNIDLLIGGSPCTSFSVGGAAQGGQTGFKGKSGLYWKYSEIFHYLKDKNPDLKFLLENVHMKEEWRDIISNDLGVQPIKINSNLLTAQNRTRLYWTNIPGVTIPENKQIHLQDILVSGTPFTEKAYCLTVSGKPALTLTGFKKYLSRKIDNFIIKENVFYTPHNPAVAAPEEVYNIGWLKVVLTKNHRTPEGFQYHKNQLYFVYQDNTNVKDYLRKLYPIEYERLQGFPNNYTFGVSDTQRYKCLGNSFTVDVIAHILKGLKDEL